MGDSNYDDLIRSLSSARRPESLTDKRRRPGEEAEVEMFVTSEDRAREAKRRQEEGDVRDHRGRGPRGKPEESVYFRFTDKNRVRKYSHEELEKFREGCRRVIVHDYGERDFYHMSDEERERNDQLARVSMKLGGLKHIYHSVDKYIEAMRAVYEAWSILAENNLLHTREEFFDYVARGIIVSSRIIAPKFRGIGQYNKDVILQYIADPSLDPKDLIPMKATDPDDDLLQDVEEQKFEMDCLLSPDEIEHVVTYEELPPEEHDVIEVKDIKRKFLKAYDAQQTYGRRKKKRGLSKVDRDLAGDLTAIMKKLSKLDAGRHDTYGSLYNFTSLAETFDKSKRETVWDRIPFRGSWQDDLAVELYDIVLEEERMNEPAPGDSSITVADQELSAFYRTLENNGISTVEMRRRRGDSGGGTYLEQKKRLSRKANRKLEAKVIDRIDEMSKKDKFRKLTKQAEKALERYRVERKEETDGYLED